MRDMRLSRLRWRRRNEDSLILLSDFHTHQNYVEEKILSVKDWGINFFPSLERKSSSRIKRVFRRRRLLLRSFPADGQKCVVGLNTFSSSLLVANFMLLLLLLLLQPLDRKRKSETERKSLGRRSRRRQLFPKNYGSSSKPRFLPFFSFFRNEEENLRKQLSLWLLLLHTVTSTTTTTS